MLYVNMGHNDIDYENKSDKELSFTFNNETQDKLIIDALLWLGKEGSNRRWEWSTSATSVINVSVVKEGFGG